MKYKILILTLILILGISAVSAAELSQNQIYSASKNVKTYIDKTGTLPNSVTINNKAYSMNEYEYAICKSIVAKDAGKTSNIQIKINIKDPSKPSGSDILQTITRKQYVTMSKNVINYIDKNGQSPNYINLGTKKIQHQTFIYGMSKVGAYVQDNKKLPTTLSLNVKSSNTINKKVPTLTSSPPNPDIHVSSMNTKDFLVGATNVKNWIDNNGKLPNYVTINGVQYDMPTYFGMASNVIASQGIGALGNKIPIYYVNPPLNSKGNEVSGIVYNTQYYDMAGRSSDFCVKNGRVPSTIGLGQVDFNFETSVYLFSKVLDYYNKYGVMPNYIDINYIR